MTRSVQTYQGNSRQQHKLLLLEIRNNKCMQEDQQKYIRSIIFQKQLKDLYPYSFMHTASVKEIH